VVLRRQGGRSSSPDYTYSFIGSIPSQGVPLAIKCSGVLSRNYVNKKDDFSQPPVEYYAITLNCAVLETTSKNEKQPRVGQKVAKRSVWGCYGTKKTSSPRSNRWKEKELQESRGGGLHYRVDWLSVNEMYLRTAETSIAITQPAKIS